ncbi:MFS transporter [Gordonia sp. ABSL49_1]|uniref:MFS transporter n=1 Tax=Gordonia sp. ABSL49_1 TaxID=2920941 RepID=UPI001F0D2695|nr:MFS transporter [Gordonia sp. ABSL49_1]MCH5642415.1 MFS transporter [Gordonia sp. ABSL49_1]
MTSVTTSVVKKAPFPEVGWAPRASATWLVIVVCSALGLVMAAMTALNLALPYIAADIQTTSSQLTWLVDAYTVALAALLLPAGAIGDRRGRRGVMIVGLALFAVGSLVAVVLDGPWELIASRALCGVAAALIMPATLSLLTSHMPADRRHMAVAIWAAVAGASGLAGFFLSGLLLEFFDWQSILLVLGGFAALLTFLAMTIGTSRDEHPGRFDVVGSLLAPAGVALFVVGLLEAPGHGWDSVLVIGCLVGGVLLGVVFVIAELRSSNPLLDMRLFVNRAFSAGFLCVVLQFFASLGIFFVLLQQLQLSIGMSALMAATAMLPIVAVLMVMSPVSAWLAVRVNLRYVLVLGNALTGLGMVLMGVIDYPTYLGVLPMTMVVAFGQGFATAPPTTAIMSNTPAESQGVGSAVNDTGRELGAAIGIAVAGSVVASGYAHHLAPLLDQLASVPGGDDIAAPVSRTLAEALVVADKIGPMNPVLAESIRVQATAAFDSAVASACLVMGIVVLVGAVVLAIVSPRRIGGSSDPIEPEPDSEPDVASSDGETADLIPRGR